MKAVVAAFNQEKALVGAFSVITNIRMDLFEALTWILFPVSGVVPSSVRIISNLAVSRSSGDTAHSGERSSILSNGWERGQSAAPGHLWESTMGQYIWKKSCVPSRSVPNSME